MLLGQAKKCTVSLVKHLRAVADTFDGFHEPSNDETRLLLLWDDEVNAHLHGEEQGF